MVNRTSRYGAVILMAPGGSVNVTGEQTFLYLPEMESGMPVDPLFHWF
jgi:hypothetical protein